MKKESIYPKFENLGFSQVKNLFLRLAFVTIVILMSVVAFTKEISNRVSLEPNSIKEFVIKVNWNGGYY